MWEERVWWVWEERVWVGVGWCMGRLVGRCVVRLARCVRMFLYGR